MHTLLDLRGPIPTFIAEADFIAIHFLLNEGMAIEIVGGLERKE